MPGIRSGQTYSGTADLAYGDYGEEMDASKNSNFEFDPKTGVYKPRQVSRPNWKVSPTGEVWQEYGSDESGPGRGWNNTGSNAFSALTGVAGGGMSGGFGAGAGGAGGFPTEDDTAAETAARTTSKENAALRLQSGLKGLRNVMAGRGIAGSGQFADRADDLFSESNAEEAATDRDIIGRRANRSAQISDRNFGAQTSLQIAQMNAAAAERSRITNLLMQFGMRY